MKTATKLTDRQQTKVTAVNKTAKALGLLLTKLKDFGKVKDGAPFVTLPSNFRGH